MENNKFELMTLTDKAELVRVRDELRHVKTLISLEQPRLAKAQINRISAKINELITK